MILPESFAAVLILALLAAACWSIWPATFKMAVNRRYELYYLDFAIGAAVATALAGLTFGILGGEITLMDNLTIVSRSDLAYAFAAGVLLNLGNMLVIAGTSLSGASISFSMAAGAALLFSLVVRSVMNPTASIALAGVGGVAAVMAIAFAAKAFAAAQAFEHKSKPPQPVSPKLTRQKPPKPPGPWKGIVLATAGGLLISASLPLFGLARRGIIEFSAYGIGLLAGAGFIASTLFFNIWFMNLPVDGPPVSFLSYPNGKRNHLLGIIGGAVWGGGLVMFQLARGAPATAGVSGMRIEALRYGSLILAALVGWLLWRERQAQDSRTRLFLTGSIGLALAALVLGFLV